MAAFGAWPGTTLGQGAVGLDHIPVAVRDLEAAADTYRALGFALKPGRAHDNGLRNLHVKFASGAGIELLTVPAAVDSLTAHYVEHLRAGDGPASLSIHARDTQRFLTALGEGGVAFRHQGALTTFPAPDLSYLFAVRDNRSPTDRPEHFAHPNGAFAIGAVWVATDTGEPLTNLLVQLGGRKERRTVRTPEPVEATVVRLVEGEVILLPGRFQVSPGRPVIGASFLVRDLSRTTRAVSQGGLAFRPGDQALDRIVIDHRQAHGLWLEFRAGR